MNCDTVRRELRTPWKSARKEAICRAETEVDRSCTSHKHYQCKRKRHLNGSTASSSAERGRAHGSTPGRRDSDPAGGDGGLGVGTNDGGGDGAQAAYGDVELPVEFDQPEIMPPEDDGALRRTPKPESKRRRW
jgi:hypothetical protein